jgi:hypothetical protein
VDGFREEKKVGDEEERAVKGRLREICWTIGGCGCCWRGLKEVEVVEQHLANVVLEVQK